VFFASVELTALAFSVADNSENESATVSPNTLVVVLVAGGEMFVICARIEQGLALLADDERAM
jgi:hypothetical protein